MAVDRVPVLKRCRSLGLDPIYLGIDKKSNRESKESKQEDQRVWSSVKREAESKVHLRRIREAFPQLLCKGIQDERYGWYQPDDPSGVQTG